LAPFYTSEDGCLSACMWTPSGMGLRLASAEEAPEGSPGAVGHSAGHHAGGRRPRPHMQGDGGPDRGTAPSETEMGNPVGGASGPIVPSACIRRCRGCTKPV